MSFTMLSAFLLLTVGVGTFVEVMRGLKRGLTRTAMTLSSVVLSALIAIPLAAWLSDLPLKRMSELLGDLLPLPDKLTEQFPSIPVLITAGADTLLSPFLFVLLFLFFRLVTRIVLACIFRGRLKARPDELVDPLYESRNAPWYRRHGRLVSGLTGGLCGLLASLILLSPVVGLLSTAHTVFVRTENIKIKWSTIGLNEGDLEEIRSTVSDPAVLLLDAMGCGLIFDATATTYLNEKNVCLRGEVEACMSVVTDMIGGISLINNPKNPDPAKVEALSRLGGEIEDSEAARLLAADFLNRISHAWLEGEKVWGMGRPISSDLVDPLLDGILQVCAESTHECAARDVSTLIRIYLIASEHGLLEKPNYEQLAAELDEGGVLGLIYDELMANPCMAHLTGELTNMSLRIMARAIKTSGFSDAKMKELMGDLSEAMNLVNGMEGSYDERVQSMKDYTLHYAAQYGVTLPESLAEMAAAALVDRLGNSGEDLDGDDLSDLFDEYFDGH